MLKSLPTFLLKSPTTFLLCKHYQYSIVITGDASHIYVLSSYELYLIAKFKLIFSPSTLIELPITGEYAETLIKFLSVIPFTLLALESLNIFLLTVLMDL